MKKIVIISEIQAGGVEKVNTMLATYLDRDKFDVTLLSITDKAATYKDTVFPYKVIFLEGRSIKRSFFKIVTQLRKISPDVILTSILDETFYSLTYKYMFSRTTKVIYVQHTVWSRVCSLSKKAVFFNIFLPRITGLFKRIDAIVYVSNGVKHDMNKHVRGIKTKEYVIYNPITYTDKYYRFREINKDNISLVTVGRLEQEKRQDILVKATGLLKDKGYNVNLFIYGKGSLQHNLESLAEKLGLKERVHFMGFSNHIQQDLAKYDIFLLSSIYESFGNVIVEAMNVGLPVVSTNCPVGPSELLDDGRYGQLVPLNDEKEMALAIERVVDNMDGRFIESAFLRSKSFSLENSIHQYQELFMQLK